VRNSLSKDAKEVAAADTRRRSSDALDWRRLESLADPSPNSGLHSFAAQLLFSGGAVRAAEGLARSAEFQRTPGELLPRLRRVMRPRFAILCYHRVGRGGVPIYSGLPASVFEAQMRYLRKHYRILSLGDVLQEMAEPRSTEPAVAITFDDGYADLYTQAFPILQRYSVPSTIYLTVGAIDSGEVAWYDRVFVAFQVAPAKDFVLPLNPPRRIYLETPEGRLRAAVEFITLMRKLPAAEQRAHCARLESAVPLPSESLSNRMLTWDQVRQMQAAGVSLGTHTITHPVVSNLDDADLEWELGESKRILENRIQHHVEDFAFPFGKSEECGQKAISALSRLGYRSAVTTEAGLNVPTTNPFALLRVSFCEERSLKMFALRLSQLFLFPEYSTSMPESSTASRESGMADSRNDGDSSVAASNA